ncbi:MAG: hypothetical protein HWN81_02945 [Candidatus Lokiarchaeota archaeon]|nr:hypothetical protein [Candidatus Lokiarchaeota archaeon]
MSRKNYIMANDKKLSTRYLGILLALVIFIFFFFPFYGLTLRYYIGSVISKGLNFLGTGCLVFGIVILGIGIISVLTGRSLNTKWIIMGIVLLWVGCWCTDSVIEFFGIAIGDSTSSGGSGYH